MADAAFGGVKLGGRVAGILLLPGVVPVWLRAAIRRRSGAGPRPPITADPTLWTIRGGSIADSR